MFAHCETPSSLNKALSHSVNEICIRRSLPVSAHVRGNLPAMVGRVHNYVSQHIHNRACPFLALAVLVRDRLLDVACGDQVKKVQPSSTQLSRLRLTLGQIRLRPYGNTLWLMLQAFQPHALGGQDMRHQLQGSLVVAAIGTDCRQNLPVRPMVIGKFPPYVVCKIHLLASVAVLRATPPM